MDIYLRQGAASPADIILRNPLAVPRTGIVAETAEPSVEVISGTMTPAVIIIPPVVPTVTAGGAAFRKPRSLHSQSHGHSFFRDQSIKQQMVAGDAEETAEASGEKSVGRVQQIVKGMTIERAVASVDASRLEVSYEARNERELLELIMLDAA